MRLVLVSALIILIASGFLASIANQTTGQNTQGSLTVSGPPTGNSVNCSGFWAIVNSQMTPNLDSVTGYTDSQLTGKNVTNINLYLCSARVFTTKVTCIGPSGGCCPLPANDTQSATIGVFNSNTGALVQSYGTIGIQTLPCWCGQAVTCPQQGVAKSFSGSHLMQSNEMLGLTFSNTQDAALVMCEGSCTGTENPRGAAVDCTPSCSNSNGFGLAGPFTYLGARNPNVTASPGLPSVSGALPLLVPIFAVGFIIVEYRNRKSGSVLITTRGR